MPTILPKTLNSVSVQTPTGTKAQIHVGHIHYNNKLGLGDGVKGLRKLDWTLLWDDTKIGNFSCAWIFLNTWYKLKILYLQTCEKLKQLIWSFNILVIEQHKNIKFNFVFNKIV